MMKSQGQSSGSSFSEGLPALEDRRLRPLWVGSETQQPVVERQQGAFGDVLGGGGVSGCGPLVLRKQNMELGLAFKTDCLAVCRISEAAGCTLFSASSTRESFEIYLQASAQDQQNCEPHFAGRCMQSLHAGTARHPAAVLLAPTT